MIHICSASVLILPRSTVWSPRTFSSSFHPNSSTRAVVAIKRRIDPNSSQQITWLSVVAGSTVSSSCVSCWLLFSSARHSSVSSAASSSVRLPDVPSPSHVRWSTTPQGRYREFQRGESSWGDIGGVLLTRAVTPAVRCRQHPDLVHPILDEHLPDLVNPLNPAQWDSGVCEASWRGQMQLRFQTLSDSRKQAAQEHSWQQLESRYGLKLERCHASLGCHKLDCVPITSLKEQIHHSCICFLRSITKPTESSTDWFSWNTIKITSRNRQALQTGAQCTPSQQ